MTNKCGLDAFFAVRIHHPPPRNASSEPDGAFSFWLFITPGLDGFSFLLSQRIRDNFVKTTRSARDFGERKNKDEKDSDGFCAPAGALVPLQLRFVGRSLGAAGTNAANSAAASHRPAFSFRAQHHRRATAGRPFQQITPAGSGLGTAGVVFHSSARIISMMACAL